MTTTSPMHTSLAQLFSELVDGPPSEGAYMLNSGDAGLLRSIAKLPAVAASKPAPSGGASIAAHVDHLCYGIELMNRWGDGERNPWATADWSASWKRVAVTEDEWKALRERLSTATTRWREHLKKAREMSEMEMNGVISSVAHLAYHLGAIRQIDGAIQGPKAD